MEGDSKFEEKYSLCSEEWEWQRAIGDGALRAVGVCLDGWRWIDGSPALLGSLALSPLGECTSRLAHRVIFISPSLVPVSRCKNKSCGGRCDGLRLCVALGSANRGSCAEHVTRD